MTKPMHLLSEEEIFMEQPPGFKGQDQKGQENKVSGKTANITREISKRLSSHFEIRDLGKVSYYLGIKMEHNKNGDILLSQEAKIEQLLQLYQLNEAKPARTPMETGFLAGDTENSPLLSNNHQYQQAIGSLLYLATISRLDVAAAVGFLARRVETPTQMDWNAVKRIIRYLAGTKNYKLHLSSTSDDILCCFVDADWAGDKQDRKSTSGYTFKLGSSAIAWSSHKQTSISMSSTEAEYVAASHAVKELQWLRQLLIDMNVLPEGAIPVFEDNQGCIKLIQSDKFNARTKHIDVYHHQLRHLREK
ncbi:uncharacterized protein LOC112461348, partial [Temnothorax curvispinosus]|uniref:Uncharacterized protein LOC112459541 n=1 Tax=Temnothorax curvispinosus TaxID=300111 RepID=A0A6J1QDY6_9HYME